MRVLSNRVFARFIRRQRTSHARLCEALDRAERGLIDPDLVGGVVERRIARPGQARSVGIAASSCCEKDNRAFLFYGFAKSDQDNIEDDERGAIKDAARDLLALSGEMIDKLVERKAFTEIDCSGEGREE